MGHEPDFILYVHDFGLVIFEVKDWIHAIGFIVRSSAAKYPTFVAASGKGGVEAVYADEKVGIVRMETRKTD